MIFFNRLKKGNMKKFLLGLLLVLFPVFAYAAEISSGETISIENKQKNPIIFSTKANVKSDVDGDLTAFAQNIDLENKVGSSAYLFGQSVNVNGPIGNRLIILSADAQIKSEVKGDLIILAGNITVENSAKIDGDVFAYGDNIDIRGQISGNLKTGGSKVVLDGAVIGKDVTIQSEQILLSDNSQVSGKLTYLSQKEMSLDSKLVKGGVDYKQIAKPQTTKTIYGVIGSIVMLIVLALMFMWLTRERLDNSLQDLSKKFTSTWLLGLVAAIVAPVLMMALIISYVGIYVFVAILLLYILAWLIGYAYSAIIVGHFLVKILTKNKSAKVDWSVIVFGSIAIVLVGLIPIVGGIARFFFQIAGFGMFVNQLKQLKSAK